MRLLLGLPVKQISKWVLFLAYEWVDLMACTVDETKKCADHAAEVGVLYT